MKSQSYFKKRTTYLGFVFLANLILVSCGTYQSVYNNDGIYDDEPVVEKIIVKDTRNYNKTEDSYFKEEIDVLYNLTDGDTFTNVDEYELL